MWSVVPESAISTDETDVESDSEGWLREKAQAVEPGLAEWWAGIGKREG